MDQQEQMDRAKLAAHIVQLRGQADLSQQELADRAKVSVATLQGWEQGKAAPGALALKSLARALGVSADKVLDYDDIEPMKRGKGRPKRVEPEKVGRLKRKPGGALLQLGEFRRQMALHVAELKELGKQSLHRLPPSEVRAVAFKIERTMALLATE